MESSDTAVSAPTSDDLDECAITLSSLSYDIQAVWEDPLVQNILRRESIRLEEGHSL